MQTISRLAIRQCVAEVRAACRRPLDEAALEALVGCLRPNFEQILDHPEGAARWADHGQQMRDHGRHLGALADFFGYCSNVDRVGASELMQAFGMIHAACRVGANGSGSPSGRSCP